MVLFSFIITTAFRCYKEGDYNENCIKARLEIKGVCSNYVIKVLEGKIDTLKVKGSWTDPSTGTTYQNVFALGNPCDFPTDINEGDTFYMYMLGDSSRSCAVCQAFRPVPDVKNSILVSKTPCP